MTAAEKWNRIVEHYNKNINATEDVVQSTWEKIFAEFFGYSSLAGEIDSKRSIRIGSIERMSADVIIKSKGADLFVVELKRYSQSFNTGIESQLFSYLKQLRNSIGILICNKIYVYAYDYNKGDDEQDRVEIKFKQDNPDGIKFIELFSKAAFNEQVTRAFVHQKIESAKSVERIKEQLTSDLAMELLRKYFSSTYNATEFEQAVEAFRIEIAWENATSENHLPTRAVSRLQVNVPDAVSSEPKVGIIAQTRLREVLESGNISKDEIERLLEREYSKQTFNINYPLLAKERLLPESCTRYYKKPLSIYGVEYFLCSQWYERDRDHLLNWISSKKI